MERTIFSDEQRQFCDLLRQVRLSVGISQAELAKLLDQPQSFVSKFESGERRLDLLELRQVCKALGVSLSDFVNRLEALLG
jgi:transcriptional regulator with XRE-family HTH domain